MTTQGKLICSYPGPAIQVLNNVFDDSDFLSELANFLVHMNDDVLDAAATTRKAQSTVLETRDTTHPRYITELLTGILRSVGRPAEIVRISKRVGDDVTWNNSKLPWRRSPLWLLIRVAIQTSLDRSSVGYNTYKEFMLFFMCCLAKEKICASLPNDFIQSMSSKISRRLKKLGSSAPDWLSKIVLQTCMSLRSILNDRWRLVQAVQRASPFWNPSQLNFTHDIQLSLSSSGDHIQKALASVGVKSDGTPFEPQHCRRGTLDDFLSSSGDFFEAAYRSEPYVTLFDVERAVEQGIDGWVDLVTDNNKACVNLEILANKYSSSAVKTYAKNPELLSVMLLTTVELWVALDKLAIREIPMLADYSPEVPTRFLEDLLLHKAVNLDRLRQVHQYISRRHSQSHPMWSVFSSPTASAFAIRFYRRSSHLQGLKARIEETAREEVRDKVAELERLNSQYADLQQQAANLDHEFYVDWYGHIYHDRYCQKCGLENQDIIIAVHEWPLPANQAQAEAVVFELDCPVSINMWRTATFHLLVELCSPLVEPTDPYIQLPDYAALQSYLKQHPRSRITLASDTKPFVVTHYKTKRIPTTKEEVCVKNGLKYYGFDCSACIPVSDALGHVDVGEYCTYELQSGPYQQLQKYVHTTSHTSNEVVANQSDCPVNLSIHEFLAFGHLRSGGILQWLNLLRELQGRSLSFRRQEVHFLLAQAISQVGPLDSTQRWTWHQVLQDPSFCNALLGELDTLVQDVEASWLEAVTMDTVSFLLRRLLASSPDKTVSAKALGLLRTVRSRVFAWLKELSDKLTRTPGDEEFRGYLRDTAAICRSTFDVDHPMIRNVLCSAEDVCMLLLSATLIREHTPSKVDCLFPHSKLLLDRDRRLSLALEDTLSKLIKDDSSDEGIDNAIRRIWSDYRPGSKWSSLSSPNSRWVSCMTAATATPRQSSQYVHFNLLDGLLLVDGKPLGRLPSEILQHACYNQLFGEQVLDIIPADVSGMDYSTRGMISGHQVYFSLGGSGSDLVIQAKRIEPLPNRSEMMELIPQQKLKGDLPDVLIEGHAHWLNLSSSIMEIRPLDNLWETSAENWRICCIFGQYRAYRGNESSHESLVDMRSKSWDMVSNLLKPLDAPRHLLVSVSQTNSNNALLRLSVGLPRYSLSFYVDEDGDLQCHSIRGMVYDENQSVGTMFGLVNQLVLRPKLRNVKGVDLTPRCILIPEGTVSFRQVGHHVSVKVNTGDSALQPVTYQTYTVDTDLGCLTGNGSLTDKLYRAYLHALTSGCGTDSLTGKSGTEEASSLLRSAGCWSIMKFSSRDAELLGLIASMCPPRNWYPKHLTCMQQVKWLDLPTNSQHHELFIIAKEIKEHYERLQFFQESQNTGNSFFKSFPSQEEHLLLRSARRTAYLSPLEFAGQPSKSDFDVKYAARDRMAGDSGEHRAYTAARTIYCRTTNTTNINVLNMAESWKNVSGDTTLSLRYGRSWLKPNLPLIWLETYNLLRRDEDAKWWYILFSLPAMAYSSPEHSDLVPVLVTFASQPQIRFESPPYYDSYTLSDGYHPSQNGLRNYVFLCATRFENSPESSEDAERDEDLLELRRRQRQAYDARLDSDTTATVDLLLRAWPCETPPQCSLNRSLYDVAGFTSNVQNYFATCYHNLKLKEHLDRVQKILDTVQPQVVPIPTQYSFDTSQSIPSYMPWILTMDQLFSRDAPWLREHDTLPQYPAETSDTSHSGSLSLNRLITMAEANADSQFRQRYVSALRASATCFRNDAFLAVHSSTQLPDAETLEAHYIHCRDNYSKAFRYLTQLLGPRSRSEYALEQAGQWPRITTHSLLRSLASNSPIVLPDDWEKCLVQLALLILELQRARRLLRLLLDDLHEDLRSELQNEGCDGWDARAHPDWLLIQLQGNFFVRRVQAEVANEMILPRSGENTAMQLNMGEGKSSVIVPIVVAALADGNQLVRVIVPKALTVQMFQILVDRLGGLTNRRVYHLPFSRSLEVDRDKVAAFRRLMSECMKKRGILVVQPEHVLSLKLVSVEKQLSQGEDRHGVALPLLELQKWLHSLSRDILDESDEILHVRYQLVYTMGNQLPMEGFPERWTTTQQVLGLVKKHASSLKRCFPLGVEYERGPSGSFPHLRVLQRNAGEKLISLIVEDVMDGHLPNFSFGQLRSEMRCAIKSFISCDDVLPEVVQLIKDYSHQSCLWSGLLLLRGLLATGILLFAFKERRWRVDYGLAPPRTMLAVPYRAKDVPAQRAEFGHPDVAITLSCLSYYYHGLTEEELRLSFEILLKQDDPSLDYDLWVQDCVVPECLRTLSGVNLKSSEQWKTCLLPLFKQNRATVDFYLSNVVFPKEAKEFPSKLSCSGWDLAEKKGHLLTGFSGTNDGQYLLPLHITQQDPEHQRGTNAKVLSYLLQPENNHYQCMIRENGELERPTTSEFLKILNKQKPEIRVLLDVGAQMLELENLPLARAWLDASDDTRVSAAIYFNKDDELTVLTRDGRTQPLLSSPFAQQLDQCVIYLDDAHTRGTNIKFPTGFRAAVTLGPKVTKDRLAQGCMRMRKLGHGHSIKFFAPLEVDWCIRSVARKDARSTIDTIDILLWTIHETCNEIQQRVPHWAQQGTDHTFRYAVWTRFCRDEVTSKKLSETWLQPEAKRLEELYGPQDLNPTWLVDSDIRERCIELGVSTLRDVSMDEEQEREVVHEVERERQVGRPPKVPPAVHSLHPDVVTFVKTGVLPSGRQAFRPAFDIPRCDRGRLPTRRIFGMQMYWSR
ncbi:hypothetical protein JVU11DRAFT_8708 [Chiua virens]|nr:hypothetical protein JVU11DRAFT_8708 [Chiua virens]